MGLFKTDHFPFLRIILISVFKHIIPKASCLSVLGQGPESNEIKFCCHSPCFHLSIWFGGLLTYVWHRFSHAKNPHLIYIVRIKTYTNPCQNFIEKSFSLSRRTLPGYRQRNSLSYIFEIGFLNIIYSPYRIHLI